MNREYGVERRGNEKAFTSYSAQAMVTCSLRVALAFSSDSAFVGPSMLSSAI